MDEQDGRRVGRQWLHLGAARQHAGIAHDRRRLDRALETDMQRHHRALAEADECEPVGRQLQTRQLRIEKGVEHLGCRLRRPFAFRPDRAWKWETTEIPSASLRSAPEHLAQRRRLSEENVASAVRARSGRCRRRHSRDRARRDVSPVRAAVVVAGRSVDVERKTCGFLSRHGRGGKRAEAIRDFPNRGVKDGKAIARVGEFSTPPPR